MERSSSREPTAQEWADLDLAWTIAWRVKSNTIVLVREGARNRQFVLLQEGTLSVTRDGRQIATLGAGDFGDLPDDFTYVLHLATFQGGGLDYEKAGLRNGILRSRTVGVAQYNTKEALEWGVTGPGLRATGVDYDLRKARPYSGYENFDFDVPVYHNGDAYDRCMVRINEMRQSLRIIRQCLDNMPAGPYKADHYRY